MTDCSTNGTSQRIAKAVLFCIAVVGAMAVLGTAPVWAWRATTPKISILDPVDGSAAATPQANGALFDAEPDGQGGFFVGGDFSCIGPTARRVDYFSDCAPPNTEVFGLAHVQANGRIDPTFAPVIDGGGNAEDPWPTVTGLSRVGEVIYFVGNFEYVDGEDRASAAAVSSAGELLPWAPRFDSFPLGIQAGASGNLLIAGGFETVNERRRTSLVELTPAGQLTGFRASGFAGTPQDFAQIGERIFLIGDLAVRSGGRWASRQALAIDNSGKVRVWNPGFSGWDTSRSDRKGYYLRAVETVGSQVVIGGTFRRSKGKKRRGLAAFDSAGRLRNWAPRLGGDGAEAQDLAALGATTYVVGRFDRVNDTKRSNAAAIDARGKPTSWSEYVPPSGGAWLPSLSAGEGDILLFLTRFPGAFD